MRIGLSIALAASLSGCVLSPDRIGTDRLRGDDALAGGVFSPGGSTLLVSAGLRKIEGQPAVCGAWQPSGPDALEYGYRVLDAGIVFVDGERVLQNLSFITQIGPDRPLGGAPSGCTPVSRGMEGGEVRIRLPAQIVEADCEAFGGCNVIRFRQTPIARRD